MPWMIRPQVTAIDTHDYQSQVDARQLSNNLTSIPPVNSIISPLFTGSIAPNIFVAARCRPVLPEDGVGSLIPGRRVTSEPLINYTALTTALTDRESIYIHEEESFAGLPSGRIATRRYALHKSFGPSTEDIEIFDDLVIPLLSTLTQCNGSYGVWFINYGMTSSGKTYTSINIFRLVGNWLLEYLANSSVSCRSRLAVSIIELKGEDCFDLLSNADDSTAAPSPINPTDKKVKIPIREDAMGNICESSTVVPIHNSSDVEIILQKFLLSRKASRTAVNDTSSRSHAIITFTLCSSHGTDSTDKRFKIVDLAGCERQKEAMYHTVDQIEEMKAINYSLGCLKECLRCGLRQSAGYVPYRNSKLTLLLRQALDTAISTPAMTDCNTVLTQNGSSSNCSSSSSALSVEIGPHISGSVDRCTTSASTAMHNGQNRHQRVVFLAHLCPARSALAHSLNTLEFATSIISTSKEKERSSQRSGPEAWSAGKVQSFIGDLNGGVVKYLAPFFHMSGKTLSTEWIGHLERRVCAAGGTVEEAHLIYTSFYELNKKYKASQVGKRAVSNGVKSGKLAAAIKAQKTKFADNINSSSILDAPYIPEENATDNPSTSIPTPVSISEEEAY